MFQTNPKSGNNWHLFDIAGHPVYMNPLFLVLIGLFAFMGVSAEHSTILTVLRQVGIWVPTLFVGILLHEIGHAAAMKRFGYGTSEIVLHGFGGVTINRRRQNAPSGKAIVISLAGPFMSFVVAVLAYLAYFGLTRVPAVGGGWGGAALGFAGDLFFWMGLINAVWGVFNLLPINPLDGGHVVLHALRGKFHDQRKAMRYTAITSLVTIGVLAVFTLVVPFLDFFFVLILGGIFGVMNWRILQSNRQTGGPQNPYGRR